MENIKLFINNQKDKINLEINEIKESISKNEYQIKEIENMIINLTKNIDTTYEVFSPYAMDKDSNISEIEKLNFNKNELKTEIEGLNTKLNDCLKSKVIIDEVYGEFNDLEKRLADSVNVTKQLVSDQGSRVTQKCNIETLKYLNYDNEKNNNYLKNIILKRLDSTLNKQSLILNMLDIDRERTKLELYKLNEETINLKNTIEKKMFHVKHSEQINNDYEKININQYIESYIKNICQKENIKIQYNQNQTNIVENKYIVDNMINVMDEAINNSIQHSNCSIVNVELFIDYKNKENEESTLDDQILINNQNSNYNQDSNNNQLKDNESNDNKLNTNTNENLDNNQDKNIKENIDDQLHKNNLHEINQINFDLKDCSKKYNIILKITDNGEGFNLQDEKVLLANEMYGISIMKYRTKLINAQINIESTVGIGTTITIVY